MAGRIINAFAPIRICDLGGWTDTWFAETGAVLNIAVYPYAEVQLYVDACAGEARRVTIHAENFGDRYVVDPSQLAYDKHPLLEASIDIMGVPKDLSIEIELYSAAPAGCSTGTSAAISVALIGALDLLTEGRRTPHEIAHLAQQVETEKLGLQCGIQDQLASAYGGVCFMEMYQYPYASVSQLLLPNSIWWELERRLVLVYLGRTHSSSEIHQEVIRELEREGADKTPLQPLREAAHAGRDALYHGDFDAFGRAMVANTDAQQSLHSGLVSDLALAVFELGKKHGAMGWKVNGAGGAGGSLTLLFGPEGARKRAFVGALSELDPGLRAIPIYLSRIGLRRWEVL